MKILGINETTHDAAIALIEDDKILFAAHAERYDKVKNSWFLNDDLINNALEYGIPDKIAYYEKRFLKQTRLKLYGGIGGAKPTHLSHPKLRNIPSKSFSHHYSHAAAGYYTSKFHNATVVVLDAIGEWNTCTVWSAHEDKLKLVYKQNYPFSFGLFYSAFTDLIGLKANEEEYIMMGMAAYGNYKKYYKKVSEYFPNIRKQKYNFHKGIVDWGPILNEQDKFDIAAAAQKVYEDRLYEFMRLATSMTKSYNLVFMGGCALNAAANTRLAKDYNLWIMPNPGDAGSALGAAAAMYGGHLDWQGPYLGFDLGGEYPVDEIFNELMSNEIVAVASGRAEYGPRALGNRSILADPRNPNIKDKVNRIKKRELFRPFAPIVLEEYAHEWFELYDISPYMQTTPRCKQPDKIPSVVHFDGTSRVQTVNRKQHEGLYDVLRRFYDATGVPVLLNTSLNIKGQPLLNDEYDIIDWQTTYGVKIVR